MLVSKLWSNLLLGIRGDKPFNKNYKTISKFCIGNSQPLAGQVLSEDTLKNGNVRKRIITVFANGKLGFETAVFSPDSTLLRAYAGILSTSGVEEYANKIGAIKNITASSLYKNSQIPNLETLL